MATIKLNERAVAGLPAPNPGGKQQLYWDASLTGFGVLCSGVSSAKTYIVQRGLPDGRKRRITIGATNVIGLSEARRRARDVLAQLYAGEDPKTSRKDRITLQQALDDYLAGNTKLSQNSRKFYRKIVNGHLADWKTLPLVSVSAEMVQGRHLKVQKDVAASGRYDGKAMANSALTVFGILFTAATENLSPPPPNPVRRLRRQWFKVERRTRLIKADDLPRFWSALRSLSDEVARDFITLLLFSGMRKGEAGGLRWDDVDFAAKIIRVPGANTKSGRQLDLPMTDVVHDLLVTRRAVGRDKFVFPTQRGHIKDPRAAIKTITASTGIEFSLHDLRRTYATNARTAGVDFLALKALLNHSQPQDTTGGYTVLSVEQVRVDAQKVTDRLKELCGIVQPAGDNVRKLN